MVPRVYLSNIAPHWPLGRQETLAAARVIGWPKEVSTFCDILRPSARKAHNPSSLIERKHMLRPTSRDTSNEKIYVASLCCLAWGVTDLTDFIAALMERGSTLISLDQEISLSPSSGAAIINRAVKEFIASKRIANDGGGYMVGAVASAKKRRMSVDEGVAKISDRWRLPSRDYPTADLLKEAGISYNTAVDRLDRRPLVQKRHEQAMRRRRSRL